MAKFKTFHQLINQLCSVNVTTTCHSYKNSEQIETRFNMSCITSLSLNYDRLGQDNGLEFTTCWTYYSLTCGTNTRRHFFQVFLPHTLEGGGYNVHSSWHNKHYN